MEKMGATQRNITIAQLCANLGRNANTVRMAWRKAGLSDFAQSREATAGELRAISEYYARIDAGEKPKARKAKESVAVDTTPEPVEPRRNWQTAVLVLLILIPTAASVQNMYVVTRQISESAVTAWLLTGLLSLTPLGFAAAGVRRGWSIALAVLLIVYESFCNTTRIYDGLMGGIKGNPTRFLGVVTDIFDCGSYGAALTIGAFTGLMIAAVQFAGIFEMKKS